MTASAVAESTAVRDGRGQTETLGVVLLLAVTIIGAMAVVAFGATALQDARHTSGHEGVGHAMTQFDSKAAIVALGNADTESVQFGGQSAGSYTIESDAGWMNVSHVNESAGDSETFVNVSLGALVYESDDEEIAYQGGGVWRKRGDGSVMVSPPEFHYRGATLTLPIIRVDGTSSVSGSARAGIENTMSARQIFPNASETTYWGGDKEYRNPVSEGNISITVRSEYYKAWAQYFRTRTESSVTEHDSNQTVELILQTNSVIGDFEMPGEGNSLSVSGMGDEHSIDNFTLTLQADNEGNNFNNMHWSLYAEEGSQDFELHVFSPDKCNGGSYGGELDVSVYYYNGTTSYYQGWQNTSIKPDSDDNFDVDCDDYTLTANFTGDTQLEYTEIETSGSDNKWHFGSDITSYTIAPSTSFDQHGDDTSEGRDGVYNASDSEEDTLGYTVNHYLALIGPSFDLTVTDGPGGSDRIDESESTGTLDYNQKEGTTLTFLHITENRIVVELD